MSLRERAREVLAIQEKGSYQAPSGLLVEISNEMAAAVKGTCLFTPDRLNALLKEPTGQALHLPTIEVTGETTQQASRRMMQDEGCQDLVLLNFASARNPGGGFLHGAKAQEEDLCRCSSLYPCLLTQPVYYQVNRQYQSSLYTDHMIYSPGVVFFKVNNESLLNKPFLASVITAPAPNAGVVLREDGNAGPALKETIWHRAGQIIALAREMGHRNLLLGAWGCGAFRNDTPTVADAFAFWLEQEAFASAFDRVVFAVLDKAKGKPTLKAFQDRFRTMTVVT